MTGPTISCPKCRYEIPLTEAMAGPVIAEMKAKLESEAAERVAAVELREKEVERRINDVRRDAMTHARSEVAQETERQRKEIAKAADDRIDRARREAEAARADVTTMSVKLAEAQQAQADAVKAKRELDDARRELDLEIERRVTASQGSLLVQARREADERYQLTIDERERTIAKMREDLEDARRRADQRDQKAQGEVLELNFEQSLKLNFPEDFIKALADRSGIGDVGQHVCHQGKTCGYIVWELKRTKNWSDDWLPKLRGIQRDAKATAAVICSQALPDAVESFSLVDGIWVTAPRYAIPLAAVLRRWVIEVAQLGLAAEGQENKAALLYRYMTGPEFRHRVQAVAEKLTELREDLDKERKGMTRHWAKREASLEVMATALAGMYGDVQGLAGKAVAELEGLTLSAGDGDAH